MVGLPGEGGSRRPLQRGGLSAKTWKMRRIPACWGWGAKHIRQRDRCAMAGRWEAQQEWCIASPGKLPGRDRPGELLEARESEYYLKCNGKLLKGLQWGRYGLNYIRWCVKNRLNSNKSGKGGSMYDRNCKMPPSSHSPLLPYYEDSRSILKSNRSSQKVFSHLPCN